MVLILLILSPSQDISSSVEAINPQGPTLPDVLTVVAWCARSEQSPVLLDVLSEYALWARGA